MSEVFRTEEFDQLIADGTVGAALDDFELDFDELLAPFNPLVFLFGGGPDLTAEEFTADRITLLAEPFSFGGQGAEGVYTVTIEGSGFGPLGDDADFEEALIEGTATGSFETITIDHFDDLASREDGAGATRILDMSISPAGYSIVSGGQSLEITGTLPDSFEQFGEILMGFDAFFMSLQEADEEGEEPDFSLLDGIFDGYSISDVVLSDGGDTLLTASFTEDALEIEIDGYRIVFCDFDFNLATFFEAAGAFDDFEDSMIWPELTLFNDRGEPMPQVSEAGFINASNNEDTAFLNFTVLEEGTGTYFIQVGADPEGPQTSGFYQLIESINFFAGDDISEEDYERIEEQADAPADITTPYTLPVGDPMENEPVGDFLGRIDPEGDLDWIRVDLDAPGSYSFRAFGIPDDLDDLNLDALFTFFGVTCVEVYNPGGDLIARADDPESLFGPPPVPGPGDDDDDDDDNGGPGDDEPVVFPPLPPGPAWGLGDPHLMTLDGVGYDFHAAGEYVMVRATDGRDFEVQARMAPVGENVTANIAAAVQLDGASVMVDAMGPDPLRVNGEAVTIEDGGFIELGGDRVYFNAGTNSYLMVHTGDGDMDTGYSAVQVIVGPQWVDIIVGLDDAWAGTVEGLLGNFDGNPDTDIALPDGTVLDRPLTFEDLYGDYRDAWRVATEDQSLFTYAAGEGPDSFYLPDYPTAMVSVADFSQEAQDAAAAQLEAAGLEPGTVAFNNALLDVLLTGDDRFIGSGQTAQENEDTRPDDAPPPVVPDTDGGGLEGLVTLSGRLVDMGGEGMNGATVTFQPAGRSVALTRHTREGDEFGFDLMPSDTGGRLEATRDYDQSSDGRPTAQDALEVLRMAVGLTPSFGEATPEAFIAADMNRDGQINAQDALEVLRAAVGLESANAPQWVFVDAEADLSETVTGRDAVNYETGVQVAGFDGDLSGLDMKGILLGDMSAY
ncbi:VWD domain-containing protein [Rhodobacteraceae bacterium 2376]|uniref:VWD domain-containing protein n=1 Tax=Rhabdonatronobacter sediminivivens TaxID=2743469 RepID=A0A7Z0KZ95_9RHOB|nr:VWD domain-containing protein [Rhabdonatronobacter sediminivivens]NYS26467.1 VWD domain-containing protein [Rhabdonatronobacter sediminivivens]